MNITESRNIIPSDKIKENTQSVFIWIDILGYSNIVEDDSQYIELSHILRKFQKLFNNSDYFNSTIISDGIILEISNIHHNRNYDKIIKILDEIGLIQFKFIIENNQFLRGGIAVGTKLENKKNEYNKRDEINNKNFISNGLARSYNLESKGICWPVIGTNKKYLEKIKKIFYINNSKEIFNLSHSFNDKGDDIFFIDFLKSPEIDLVIYNLLLSNKIKEFKDAPKVRNKYIWLYKYFNKYKECNIPKEYKESIL